MIVNHKMLKEYLGKYKQISGPLILSMYFGFKNLAGTNRKSAGSGVKFVMAKFVIMRVRCTTYVVSPSKLG